MKKLLIIYLAPNQPEVIRAAAKPANNKVEDDGNSSSLCTRLPDNWRECSCLREYVNEHLLQSTVPARPRLGAIYCNYTFHPRQSF